MARISFPEAPARQAVSEIPPAGSASPSLSPCGRRDGRRRAFPGWCRRSAYDASAGHSRQGFPGDHRFPRRDLNYFFGRISEYPLSAELKHNRSRTFHRQGVGHWEARPMRFLAVPALALMALSAPAAAITCDTERLQREGLCDPTTPTKGSRIRDNNHKILPPVEYDKPF